MLRSFAVLALHALGSLLAAAPAIAQDASRYPSKSILWIVDAAPGGSSDLYARTIGKRLQDEWGQPVVVENRPGAAGTVAFNAAVRAPGDGYTLVSATNTLTLGLAYKTGLSYSLKDFAAISLFFTAPNALVVPASSKIRSVADIQSAGKSQSGGLAFGTPGIGTASHLSGQLLGRRLGVETVHVPLTGGAPIINELLAGRLDFAFVNIPAAAPMVRDGKLRMLAVSSKDRLPQFPDVPTLSEHLPGFVVNTWFGVIGRAGTSPAVLAKLNGAINGVLKSDEMRKRIADAGAEPQLLTVQEFQAFLERDIGLWRDIIKQSGVDLKD